MTTLAEVDFLGDERLRTRLVRWSFVVLGAGAAAGLALGMLCCFEPLVEFSRFGAWGAAGWLCLLAVISLGVLPVHEFVHGALFRLLGGRGTRVRYGFQSGMLYATCPGLVLARARFLAVLAGPAVVLSACLLGAGARLGLPLLGYAAFVLHLSGCSGDLLAVWLIACEPACTHCEDTEAGVRLLG
ncbi:DUF3267 domain-containing protein [Olsenella uli]|uniref:DUF3267 domain-containing protein n=1 Tax=Olsenella uli TaxID=133926 RepID=UPI0012ABF738|nr:DUF3267 domain-containing protein [Olsenella uli]